MGVVGVREVCVCTWCAHVSMQVFACTRVCTRERVHVRDVRACGVHACG